MHAAKDTPGHSQHSPWVDDLDADRKSAAKIVDKMVKTECRLWNSVKLQEAKKLGVFCRFLFY